MKMGKTVAYLELKRKLRDALFNFDDIVWPKIAVAQSPDLARARAEFISACISVMQPPIVILNVGIFRGSRGYWEKGEYLISDEGARVLMQMLDPSDVPLWLDLVELDKRVRDEYVKR